MKELVYDGIQKVQCREVSTPKIEKDDTVVVLGCGPVGLLTGA